MKYRSIAVDGPSGAGKSTLARMLAKSLGYLYVDTGAIYRTVGLAAYRNGISPDDSVAVIHMLPRLSIDLRHGADGLQHMYLDNEDVSDKIRLPEISQYASMVSAIPEVRAFLMDMQRELAEKVGVTPQEFFDEKNSNPTLLNEFITEAKLLNPNARFHILGIMKELNGKK